LKFARADKKGELQRREGPIDISKYDEFLKMATLTKQNQVAQENTTTV
jgi:hypothetical protein